MKKTSGAIPGPVGSPPTAPPTPAAPAAPSTPSGLSSLHPGDARHEIAAIRRSSGRSSGNQRELQLPSAPSTSPLAGRGERTTENRGGSNPGRNAGQDTTERGRRVGQGGNADSEEEEEDNGPAGEPAFPEVQRLLYRATDLLSSSPVAPARLPAQGPQHQTSGAQDQTAAATGGPMPTPPPGSHPPTPNPFAPSAPARPPKIVIKGYRAGPAATNRPAAAENQPSSGKETVPLGDGKAVAAAGEERAATAQGPKRPTKIKFVSRPRSSLAPPRGDEEEEEEAGDQAPSHDEPGGASAAAQTGAAKVGRPRGRKGAPASAAPLFGASQHQNQTLGLGEPGAAAGNTTTPAPKPKRKPRAKKDAAPPAGLPATSHPLAASSGPSGEAPKPPGRKPRAKKPSATGTGPSTSAPGQPNNNRGRDEASFPLPAASNRAAEQAQEAQGNEALFDVLGGLVSGAFVQPNQGGNGPSQGSDQPSLDDRLPEHDVGNLPSDLPEYPDRADPGLEQLDAAPIDPALGAPIPYVPLDPITALFPTVPVCFDANSLTARIWYPFNFQGEIDPHWETWPTRRNYPLTPGTGPCDPSDLRFEPDSTLPQAVHEDIQALARDGTLFARTLESVNWAHAALDNCGYDFDRDPLLAPLPRAVRAALAGYRPFVFPRTGRNPFVGVNVPRPAADAPLGGGGDGGGGMEYEDPAEANPLGDGVVVGPALPPTIRYGGVCSRAENALLIPAEWREGVGSWNEMGMGLEGDEKGRGEPDAAAGAAIEEMPLEGPAYVDQPNDLDDDLYGNSQAGDIAAERQDLEPEDNAAMDFEHPTHPGAAPQLTTNAEQTDAAADADIDEGFNEGVAFEGGAYAHLGGDPEDDLYANNQAGDTAEDQQASMPEDNTAVDVDNPIHPGAVDQQANIPDRTRGLEDDLGNDQSGNTTRGQQLLEPNDNTAIDGEHPIYPQLAIGGNGENNGFGFGAGEEGGSDLNGLGDNAILDQPHDPARVDMDAIVLGGSNLAVPDYHPNNLNQQSAALNNHFIISDGHAAVVEGQPVVFDEQPAALNKQPAAVNDSFIILDEQAAAFHRDFFGMVGQAAPIEEQPAALNDQPLALHNNFLLDNDQAAIIEGQPAILNDQPVVLDYDLLALDLQAAIAEAQPPVLNEQPAAWNDHFVIENGRAAVIPGQPAALNYNFHGLNEQAANDQAAITEGQPAVMDYDFFDLNQDAAIEDQAAAINYDFFDLNQGAAIEGQLELANLNLEDYNGNAWPNFELNEAEWDAELEAFRLAFERNLERAQEE